MEHFQEAGEAIAEDVAGEESFQHQQANAAGEQRERNAGHAQRGRATAKEPGGGVDGMVKDRGAGGPKYADRDCERDQG